MAFCLFAFLSQGQTINWKEFLANQDLVWNNNVDSNFFHGAFIGDGIQGAMIMQDAKNPNGLRMLLGHYKALSNNTIPNFEYINSKVYAGNIVIAPAGKRTTQTMRTNIYDGEASGVITTDKGSITWRSFGDRKNNVLITVLKGEAGEINATLGVREEWGITPLFYLRKVTPSTYASQLPPLPELSNLGNINLVINKMKTQGAHVVASQLIRESDNTQILYVAIGTDNNVNTSTAAINAQADAVKRVQASVYEGYQAITQRHQSWWHNYMESSYLAINEDAYWQKFWYLQLYKFACSSAENSDLIMDTQGAWVYQAAWASIWWNLNVQLSYMPMYSANKLDAGRGFINGMNRMYKSGILKSNANGVGINIGRITTYDGNGNWGDEFGNMPWLLQMYWRYWKYSGDDNIGQDLFPMLKDNATFLMSKLKKGVDGKYHMDSSRSPEFEDTGAPATAPDANYALMSACWVFQTLLKMDTELVKNDPQRSVWQEKLDNLVPFPQNEFGYKVFGDYGFDKGHRHSSHLMAIFPYHTINPDQGDKASELIRKSIDRWQTLTQTNGFSGYTFSLGSPMYATLGDGEKAISTLDLMKSKNLIQQNTMYYEGGGAVIETPLSVVESIDYMLLQSWSGIIRIFPAVPSRWKNTSFKKFRTEGAFLVSANYSSGTISDVVIYSEKGKTCTMRCPWKGKFLIVNEENNKRLVVRKEGDNFIFQTETAKNYFITASAAPEFKWGKIEVYPKSIKMKVSMPILVPAGLSAPIFSGLEVKKNGTDVLEIAVTNFSSNDSILEIILKNDILNTDNITLSYTTGNIQNADSVMLQPFSGMYIENLLPGSSPVLIGAKTNWEGTQIELSFNKKMNLAENMVFSILNSANHQNVGISSVSLKTSDASVYVLTLSSPVFLEDTLGISYIGTNVKSLDNGTLKAIVNLPVTNLSHGKAPQLKTVEILKGNKSLKLTFDKDLNPLNAQAAYFVVIINGKTITVQTATSNYNAVVLTFSTELLFGDIISVRFENGSIKSIDGGELTSIVDFAVQNTLPDLVATQSTTYNGAQASYAIDGNTSGIFTGASVTHTNPNSSNPWWTCNWSVVDSIPEVTIWNRADCCGERLANFYVFLSKTPFTSDDPAVTAATKGVWKYYNAGIAGAKTIVPVNTCAKYLRIQIVGTGTLSLAEVQINRKSGNCEATSIENIRESEKIEVFPNPINGKNFTVNLSGISGGEDAQIEFINVLGRMTSIDIKQINSSYNISVKDAMAKGIYFLLVKIHGKTISKKLIF